MNLSDIKSVFDEANDLGIPYDLAVIRTADLSPIWCDYDQKYSSLPLKSKKSAIVYTILTTVATDYYFRGTLTPRIIHALNDTFGNHFRYDGYRVNRKQLAVLAGLGKIGKQSLVFTNKFGLNAKIDAIFTDLEFDEYAVFDGQRFREQCGSCPAPCVSLCPIKCKMDYHLDDVSACDNYITPDWDNPEMMCRACIQECETSERMLEDFPEEVRKRLGRPDL
ncbi:MAG: hypothetical protein ACYTFO_10080 [Planctomycetota bacterium]|jgi:hypothetical protein